MEFNFERNQLLAPLQQIIGAIGKHQIAPILANVLITSAEERMRLTATDNEIELVASTDISIPNDMAVTVPAQKLLDICKNLPEDDIIHCQIEEDKVSLKTKSSRFVLATLPASGFPDLDDQIFASKLEIPAKQLGQLLLNSSFAMAQQDVRYYLNGVLLEFENDAVRAVATDGHRMAFSAIQLKKTHLDKSVQQIILPRKGVIELQRLANTAEETIAELQFNNKHLRIDIENLRFTSKLIAGRFPDYTRVIPNQDGIIIVADRLLLRQALLRASILSNEKYRGVRLVFQAGDLGIHSQNPDKEEAEDHMAIEYKGNEIEVSFNVNYLLDVLNIIKTEKVHIHLQNANSSCLICPAEDKNSRYVIMPMRL